MILITTAGKVGSEAARPSTVLRAVRHRLRGRVLV